MATKKTASNPTILLAPMDNGTRGDILQNVRPVTGKNGKENFVLEFSNAVVVMPGAFRRNITVDKFPNGLYVGQKLAAYWEDGKFNLAEVK